MSKSLLRLTRLLHLVDVAWPDHGTRPGVHLSDLGPRARPKDGRFYGSIKTFEHGPERGVVVASAYGPTLEAVVEGLIAGLVAKFTDLVKAVEAVSGG